MLVRDVVIGSRRESLPGQSGDSRQDLIGIVDRPVKIVGGTEEKNGTLDRGGMRFRGLSTRSLRDILGATSETTVFDYINNGAPLARSGVAGYIALTSVISPGLLFDELEVERTEDQLQKPALVPPPNRTANR